MLYSFMAIVELERLEQPIDDLRAVREAQRTAQAFNDPTRLWDEETRIRAALFGGGVSMDRVAQIMAEVRKYPAKRVIRGD